MGIDPLVIDKKLHANNYLKSIALINIGAGAVLEGHNVVHYTLEMPERQVENRYDNRFTRKSFDYLKENSNKSLTAIMNIQKMMKGKLIIKRYRSNECTVDTIRSHLTRLHMESGFKPDLVIIDYGDLVQSRRSYKDKRFELESVYLDLRDLGAEYDCPVWTACFTGDTKIKTLDGDIAIRDLVGKEPFPIFTYDHKEERIKLGKSTKVWMSKTNAKIWELTLDNGEVIRATGDHKFMLRDGSYQELQHLTLGVSLMPLYSREASRGEYREGRELINLNNGSEMLLSRMIGEYKLGRPMLPSEEAHHHDEDISNDTLDNIIPMTKEEHHRIHFTRDNPAKRPGASERISRQMTENNPMHNPDTVEKMRQSKIGQPVNSEEYKDVLREKWTGKDSTNPIHKMTSWQKTLNVHKGYVTRYSNLLETDPDNEKYLKSKEKHQMKVDELKDTHNHKVVSVRETDEYEDVYDMEVEGTHNFALSSGIMVHNSQTNRGGLDKKVITIADLAEAFNKANIADFMIALCQSVEEKDDGIMRWHAAKNRGGVANITLEGDIDYPTMSMTVYED